MNTGEFEFSGDTLVILRDEVLPKTTITTNLPQSKVLQVLTNSTDFLVVPIGSRPARWDLFKGFTSRHELASGTKQVQVKCNLATRDRGVDLFLSFAIEWSIQEPIIIVQEDIRDISKLLLRLLGDELRREARKWQDDQLAEATDSFRDVTRKELRHGAFSFKAYDFSARLEEQRLNILKQHQYDRLSIEVTTGQGLLHLIQRTIAKNPDDVLGILRQLRADQIGSIKDSNEIIDLLRDRGWSDKKIDETFNTAGAVPSSIPGSSTPAVGSASAQWWQLPNSGTTPKSLDNAGAHPVAPVEPDLGPDIDD